MIDTTGIARRLHGPARVRPATTDKVPAVDMDRWCDTLARLARSHHARRIAADPSRPWLTAEKR
jgi:hypothetical protein